MSPSAPSASSVKHFSLMFSSHQCYCAGLTRIYETRLLRLRPRRLSQRSFSMLSFLAPNLALLHSFIPTSKQYTSQERMLFLPSGLLSLLCSEDRFQIDLFFIESVPTRFLPIVFCGHWLFGALTTRPLRMSPAWMPTVSCASSG